MTIPAPATVAAPAQDGIGKRRPAVLFVDDDALVLSGMRRALAGLSGRWDLDFAASFHEALNAIQGKPYRVLVIDSHMPEGSGAQLAWEAQQLCPQARCILLSGESERDAGPVSENVRVHLQKPCPRALLQAAIQDLLDETEHHPDRNAHGNP